MPKREPSPKFAQDSKFLVIEYPYPSHANMEVVDDLKQLSYWISNIIGSERLYRVFHKPTVSGPC